MYGTYIALIQADSVKRAEVIVGDPDSENPVCGAMSDAEIYIGTTQAAYEDALDWAAKKAGVHPGNIRLVQLAFCNP